MIVFWCLVVFVVLHVCLAKRGCDNGELRWAGGGYLGSLASKSHGSLCVEHCCRHLPEIGENPCMLGSLTRFRPARPRPNHAKP